jgi:glyoxylase-like metal-dependent hydrolase (beta-lactamase superfamily II)
MRGFVVRHPDGVILFDTGSGGDHQVLNEMYRPTVVPIVDAINGVGVDERDVVAIVNSHLHFDHCGQNRFLPSVPVWLQAAEYEMVETPRFTIPEWARVPAARRRMIDGDAEIVEGVSIVATPGHTPGYQSLLVAGEHGRTVIGGQCCYTCDDYLARHLDPTDVHDETWLASGRASLDRLHALEPDLVHFSHDRTIHRKQP